MTKIETLLLKQPTVSAREIAFLYAGDIWVCGLDGSSPRRLTAQKGQKSSPIFSPDGEWLAFSGNYDGNQSVYVIHRSGGEPRRLTYHPFEDLVRGWTVDGQSVLFASARASTSRNKRLFTVPLAGGLPTALQLHSAERGAFSADGKYLAFTPFKEAFWSWKRYRGGQTVPIWMLDLETFDHREIPHENASDTFPCWVGEDVYFLSDRSQTMNMFRWKSSDNTVEQVTFHQDFDIRSLTAGSGMLAYEHAGRLHLYFPETGDDRTLSVSVNVDLPYARAHFRMGKFAIQSYAISPSGARALFEARGDIYTVPAKKGDIRNLTRAPGTFERDPAWSPDGQSICYFSDASGEYELVITDQKGYKKNNIPLGKLSFFYSPVWSPDSKKIAFTDKALNLSYVEVETKNIVQVASDSYDHPERSLNPAWSPDSQWLAYTRRLDNQIRAVYLYNLAEGKSTQITDGMSDATNACFSCDGKHLYFAASSNYGLNVGWLDMSSVERPVTRSLYLVVLNQEDASPFVPESDDEKPPEEKKAKDETAAGKDDPAKEPAPPVILASPAVEGDTPPVETPPAPAAAVVEPPTAAKTDVDKSAPPKVKIDLDGIAQRILALPVPPREYTDLQVGDGKLFFMEALPNQGSETEWRGYTINVFDFKERKLDVFVDRVLGYRLSADGKKVLLRLTDRYKFAIVSTDKRPDILDGMLDMDKMEMWVDPQAEWRQIFREAYRIHRDFFYDPELHGLDLEATYQKYLPFVEHIGHRDDLNYLLAEFSGELVVGHAYVGDGDIPTSFRVSVGLLGADYEVTPEGYYRFKRIYPGLNWHPELRSPLTEPGVNVHEGDYLLGVNGMPLRAPDNVYRLFEKTVERITELQVGPSPDESEARYVSVRPLGSELSLRHWSWVEGNRKKVDELSNGRVAYVYMPDTSLDGYASFNRYYFSQLDKSAVVLDERYNGGGLVADYVIDLLDRPLLAYWATREGKEFVTPNASIFGPRVMIINEQAGSGGDAMPQFFRRRSLGKLVGKRTWGGLIGIYDYPPLIDGGYMTSPRMAIYSPDGAWEVENEGVAPDIEIEMTPRLVREGRDPQLEKAVEIVLAELEAAPPVKVPRPAPARRAVKR
jgi:tricorn protease